MIFKPILDKGLVGAQLIVGGGGNLPPNKYFYKLSNNE